MRLPLDMKLVGKKEQSYASLDISESPHEAPIRRSSSKLLNVQLSPSAVSTMSISSDDSSHAFPRQGRRDSMEDSVQPFYNTVATDVLAALDGPIRQLAFETKGALLATGYVTSCCCSYRDIIGARGLIGNWLVAG